MMKKIRKFAALVLTLCVLASLAAPALAASGVQSELQGSAAYMLSAVKAPEVGSIGGEWTVIGLARSGYPVPANYFDDYYARVEKYVKDCAGVLHERKYTEYSRVILALTAIGRDPSNVAGYNLLTPLGDFEKTIWQGLNGPIWALIALDSGSYDIPKNPAAKTQATRQLYVNEILNNQLCRRRLEPHRHRQFRPRHDRHGPAGPRQISGPEIRPVRHRQGPHLALQSPGQQGRLRLLGHDERRIRCAGRRRPLRAGDFSG